MKTIKKLIFVLASTVFIVMLTTKFDYDNTKAFDNIITFLSIAAGFNITALSIIANSSFSGRLYNIEDKKDNSSTLLHTLVNKFKYSILIFLITIGLILLFSFVDGENKITPRMSITIKETIITLPKVLKSTIWYLTLISFYLFNDLLVTFSRFVFKSAPKA